MKNKQILFILPKLNAGGVGQVVKALCKEYRQKGHGVTILSLTKRQEIDHHIAKYYADLGADIHHLPFKKTGLLTFIGSFFMLLNYFVWHRKYNLILIPAIYNAIVTIPAAKLALHRAKIIVNAHTAVSQYLQTQGRIKRAIFSTSKLILPFADVVANDSKGATKDLKKCLSLKKVRTLYNPGCTVEDLNYTSTVAPHPWLDDKKLTVFVACGRFVASKNFSFMLSVFAELHKSNKNLRLIILGYGEEEQKLKAQAVELELSDVVSFEGHVTNVKDYMYHANYFWLTSKFEGFSIVLAEALSMGTACIANNCPYGPKEVLDGGKYGLLVDDYEIEHNVKEIKAFIKRPAKDKSHYRERAEKFTSTKMATAYLNSVNVS